MKTLLTFLFTLSTIASFAQTGPGGVGTTDGSSELVLWLKADDINQISGTSLTEWLDASGYGNDASATANAPMYLDNQLFGNASVNFSSLSEQALMIDHSSDFNSNFVSVFVIARINANSDSKGAFVIKTTNKNMNDGFGLIRLNSKEKIRFFAGNYGVNRDSEHIHYGLFDLIVGNYRSGNSSNKVMAMVNNAGSGISTTTSSSPSMNDMYLGARPDNGGGLLSYLDGDIAEVIIMAKDLPSTERILISNYLAAKYGFAISNDKYSYHYTHSHDVIGIGKFKDFVHSSSQAGVLELRERPNKPLVNGNFLMVGHDGKSMNTITTNLPEEYSQRFERTWRSHVNGVIKERVKFHLDGMDVPTDKSEYVLLVDYDGNGDFSNATVVNATGFNISTNTVSFNKVELHTGAVFTLAYYKSITWDGNNFANGSGPAEAPDQTDGGRRFIVTGAGATISATANVYEVNVSTGASINIDSTICFTINTNIHNDGVINIGEDGSLIQRSEGPDMNTGTGTYIAKQTGLNSNNGYNTWGAPMKAQNLEMAFPDVNPCDLLTYSALKQDWIYDFPDGYSTTCAGNPVTFTAAHSIDGGDGIMNPMRGYFITGNTTNPQKTFSGKVNNGYYEKPIYATEYGDNINWDDDDWNFISNPYPSALDPFAFWQENAVDNPRITDAIYFWDDAGTLGAAYDQYNDYASWNLTGGIASDNSPLIVDSLNHIGLGQGMMVWASDSAGTDTIGNFRSPSIVDTLKANIIVFNNSMRSCKNSIFYKSQQSSKELVWLVLESPSGKKGKFLLGTVPGATDGIDNSYDARRVSINNLIEFSSMILNDTTSYTIQGIDPLDALTANKSVSLKVVSVEGGLHTISRAAFETGGAPLKMYLRDNLLNITHDLDNGDYQVYLNANTRDLNRFEIVFEYDALNNTSGGTKGGGITSVEDLDNTFELTSVENGFTITSTEGITGEIAVYDVAGHLVYQEVLTSVVKSKTITLSQSTGVYIVKVTDQDSDSHTMRTVMQ